MFQISLNEEWKEEFVMDILKEYCSYDQYHVIYDTQTHRFSIYYKKKPLVTDMCLKGIYRDGLKVMDIADFSKVVPDHPVSWTQDNAALIMKYYRKDADEDAALILTFLAGYEDVRIVAQTPENDAVIMTGSVCTDKECLDDIFPVSFKQSAGALNCSVGNAVSAADHAIYNRKNDTAIVLGASNQTKIIIDNKSCQYSFEITVTENGKWEGAQISHRENVLAQKYNIAFSPVNRNATFSRAPVGWMTWYAVKFNACEEKVLTNAKWQADNLKDYGANAVWVDWEWYHNDFSGDRKDGVNSLQPDSQKYPNGMKYVADQIKEMGLVPALWLGFTNEPSKNEYIEKYPEIVLQDQKTWCGRYYFDISNPHYLDEYLPAALANVHKWGYEAVKYDTIPVCLWKHEENHEKMYDPSLTTKEAYRNMVKKTREILGENMFMLSCSGATNSTVLWASDIFDAARIGDDIFTWEEHLINIKRIAEFYPLHNVQFYVDADNVVLRDAFNNFEQAKARVAVVSLLGLPMTFGDEFADLSEEKIMLLKKSLPILDIHPEELSPSALNDESLLINLRIDKGYEQYLVTGAFNLTDQPFSRKVDICKDLNLDSGVYLVYDFYRNEYLGKTDGLIELDFLPYECRILSLRPYMGVPQIISTSRHISQGAVEITEMEYFCEKLTFRANLIKDDAYTATVYIPDGYKLKNYTGFSGHEAKDNLLKLFFLPEETKEYRFCVSFEKS